MSSSNQHITELSRGTAYSFASWPNWETAKGNALGRRLKLYGPFMHGPVLSNHFRRLPA